MEESCHQILVAEDSSVLRIILKRTFSVAGFSVMTAVDGLDAWQICKQHHFNLIVTDEQMPGLYGSELCQRLRKMERFAKTPILMVTGKAYELDQEQLRKDMGISAVFVKPFSPTKILQAARSHLAEASTTTTSSK